MGLRLTIIMKAIDYFSVREGFIKIKIKIHLYRAGFSHVGARALSVEGALKGENKTRDLGQILK